MASLTVMKILMKIDTDCDDDDDGDAGDDDTVDCAYRAKTTSYLFTGRIGYFPFLFLQNNDEDDKVKEAAPGLCY